MITENTSAKIITNSDSDELSIKDLVLKLRRTFLYLMSNWLIIVFLSILGGILGFFYAQFKKPIYIASCTFVLEESGGGAAGALGQYSGLASMVGIDLSSGGGGIFQGDNLLELYRSKNMLRKTLLSSFDFDGKNTLLVNKYIEVYSLRNKWDKVPKLKNIQFRTDLLAKPDRIKDSLLNSIIFDVRKANLSVSKPDKKLNIIAVDISSENELLSYAMNSLIVKNVNDFYVQTKTKKSLENLYILQHQADSIRRSLNGAISNVAASIDFNPNANQARQVLKVPSQKRQVDLEANKAILTELVKNLEISKVSLRKETPLIQIIDEPNLPLDKQKLSVAKGSIMGIILGGLIAIFTMIASRVYKNIMI
jgi:hypothetical protein